MSKLKLFSSGGEEDEETRFEGLQSDMAAVSVRRIEQLKSKMASGPEL